MRFWCTWTLRFYYFKISILSHKNWCFEIIQNICVNFPVSKLRKCTDHSNALVFLYSSNFKCFLVNRFENLTSFLRCYEILWDFMRFYYFFILPNIWCYPPISTHVGQMARMWYNNRRILQEHAITRRTPSTNSPHASHSAENN